ncbi:MAG: hypothetical protein A2X46_09470 [Lentisphaerae bacterium GWF2_57_35]|nr:MAG: hypothetical protein A2X46_09470 [Lentisphaerae bacterium GWF2_57_35]
MDHNFVVNDFDFHDFPNLASGRSKYVRARVILHVMKRGLVTGGILFFWAAMMFWLIRYEAFPSFFTHRLNGYSDLMQDGPLVSDSWMKILVDGRHVGFSHTHIDVKDNDPAGRVQINNQTAVNVRLLGRVQQITARSTAWLDILYKLQRFAFAVNAADLPFSLHGERKDHRLFEIRARTPMGSQVVHIELPDDLILYSPLTELALKKLKPGQTLTLTTLDPSSLSRTDMLVTALRQETLLLNGTNIETSVLSCRQGGLETLTWLDADGRLVKQTTPLGWQLEACDPSEAAAFGENAVETASLFKLFALAPAFSTTPPETAKPSGQTKD